MGQIMNCAIPVCCPANSPPPPPPTIVFLPTPPAVPTAACYHYLIVLPALQRGLMALPLRACRGYWLRYAAESQQLPTQPQYRGSVRSQLLCTCSLAVVVVGGCCCYPLFITSTTRPSTLAKESLLFSLPSHTQHYLTSSSSSTSLPVITSCPVIIRSMTPGLCGGAPVNRPLLHSITGRQVRRILLL